MNVGNGFKKKGFVHYRVKIAQCRNSFCKLRQLNFCSFNSSLKSMISMNLFLLPNYQFDSWVSSPKGFEFINS